MLKGNLHWGIAIVNFLLWSLSLLSVNIKLDSLWARLEEMDSWEIQCAIHIELWQWSKNIFTFAFCSPHILAVHPTIEYFTIIFYWYRNHKENLSLNTWCIPDSDSLDNNHKRSPCSVNKPLRGAFTYPGRLMRYWDGSDGLRIDVRLQDSYGFVHRAGDDGAQWVVNFLSAYPRAPRHNSETITPKILHF